MAPRISVVIPHFNDLDNLKVCLDCLMRQTLPMDQFEIIVADNNSSAGLEAVKAVADEVAGHQVQVVLASIQGAGAARNCGVLASQADVLAFTDSDCQPAPTWLECGLRAIEQADIVGGKVQVVLDDPNTLHPVEAFEAVFAFNNQDYVTEKRFSVTANLLVSRTVFDAVGGFRQSVSEDKDWCHRAIAAGYSLIYQDDVCVGHPARRSWGELVRKWQRLTRENYHLVCERQFGQIIWAFRSWAVLLSVLPHTWVVLNSGNLDRLKDKLQAILILFRVRFYRFFEAHRILFSK
ncbi:MAG: glycosyltransferase [Cyanobacteria bacterium J069]|nr:MAG: glycosyltransferase [Cyanobacteria bacterium J069]